MTQVDPDKLRTGQTVYYIPSHLDKTPENAEAGVIKTINAIGVYVKYTSGDTAALTPVHLLYI